MEEGSNRDEERRGRREARRGGYKEAYIQRGYINIQRSIHTKGVHKYTKKHTYKGGT